MTVATTNPHPYAPRVSGADDVVSVMGCNGIAVSHHYLASQVGLEILKRGGNAVDAAVAVSAALGVVEPAMCGAAGTGNMLIRWAADDQVYCLDFSGRAPARVGQPTPDELYFGAGAAMVPGCVGGWLTALERFGTMDAASVFAPAIAYAEDGFPISPTLAYYIRRMAPNLRANDAAAAIFLPDGRVPDAGEILRQADLAESYRTIVDGGAETFYRGALAQRMLRSIRDRDGWLSDDDLAEFQPTWESPLSIDYRGWAVMTPPPPCSGVQMLETLEILEGFDLGRLEHQSPDYLHLLIEAIKLARHDRVYGGMADAGRYLEPEHVAALQARIDPTRAAPSAGDWYSSSGNTTHFCVADRSGTLVSSTQTLGALFGSNMVVEGTGLLLNGLLFLFDTDPRAPNRLAGGKKLDLVMAPVLARCDDGEHIVLGSPGGQGSLHTILQMLLNMIEFGLVPQAAIEAPRFLSFGRRAFIDKFGSDHAPTALGIEDRYSRAVCDELTRRGHNLESLGEWSHTVGAGAAIVRRPNGVLVGGSDPRRDGLACAF